VIDSLVITVLIEHRERFAMPKSSNAVPDTWQDVAERFETFGKHVRRHFATGSAASAADRQQLEKSARALLAAVEDTLAAASGVIKDAKVRNDLGKLADALRTALVTSLDGAGTLVRAQVPRAKALARKRTGAKATGSRSAPRKSATHRSGASTGL